MPQGLGRLYSGWVEINPALVVYICLDSDGIIFSLINMCARLPYYFWIVGATEGYDISCRFMISIEQIEG